VLAVGAGWILGDRASRKRQAETKVLEALEAATPGLEEGNPWDRNLVSALRTAEAQLQQGHLSRELQGRVEQLQRDVIMLAELERLLLKKAQVLDEHFDEAGSADEYRQVFEAFGIDVPRLEPEEAVHLVQASAIRRHLSLGLTHWRFALVSGGERRGNHELEQVSAVVRQVGSDPWLQQLREAILSKDSLEYERLLFGAPVE